MFCLINLVLREVPCAGYNLGIKTATQFSEFSNLICFSQTSKILVLSFYIRWSNNFVKHCITHSTALYLHAEMPQLPGRRLCSWRRRLPCSLFLPAGRTLLSQCLWNPHTLLPVWTWWPAGEATAQLQLQNSIRTISDETQERHACFPLCSS